MTTVVLQSVVTGPNLLLAGYYLGPDLLDLDFTHQLASTVYTQDLPEFHSQPHDELVLPTNGWQHPHKAGLGSQTGLGARHV